MQENKKMKELSSTHTIFMWQHTITILLSSIEHRLGGIGRFQLTLWAKELEPRSHQLDEEHGEDSHECNTFHPGVLCDGAGKAG
jgi:hypothetical protein